MRDAETVLRIIRDRGIRRLPLEGLYRQLFNPNLYLRAYGRIYRNEGAMTQGITEETPDGMSLDKIQAIIERVRSERYQWTPVRRVHIPKPNGKQRPLGIPTWSDKLLQEVLRSLLEAYYEPQFSDHSHGFRAERGCHSALQKIQRCWRGTKWFIEGDIKGCFDNIDHVLLLSILREHLHDNRFLRLIDHLLQAGYLEQWRYHATLSGTPQGGILSPLLSNIYLDRLDQFVENTLLPEYNRGDHRQRNPAYRRYEHLVSEYRKEGAIEAAKTCYKQMQQLPAYETHDPDYRRLRYLRYADDFLLGFAGPKIEAEAIKEQLKTYLWQHLKLELSEEKTLITHAQTERARFLGYDIATQFSNEKLDARKRRVINCGIELRVPTEVIQAHCARYMREGKPVQRAGWLHETDFGIVSHYQSDYRGIVQYYLLAINVGWLSKLHWVMQTSLLKTLAGKHNTSVGAIYKQYGSTVGTPYGPRKCLEVFLPRDGKKPLRTCFGGIPLRRKTTAILHDLPTNRLILAKSQLEQRVLADECEICHSTEKVEVHHIRKLADLHTKGQREKPLWMQLMAAKQRKTLIVCRRCHEAIHAGRPHKEAASE